MKRLVLASKSPRRQQILQGLGLQAQIIPSNIIEEVPRGVPPQEVAIHLALQKARDVASRLDYQALVIGADTIVVLEGEIMGKPGSPQEAFDMLSKLAGKEHEVITGIALVDSGGNVEIADYQSTRVKMKEVDSNRLWKYVETGEPLDKAGAYAVQGKASVFIERIDGCFFNVMGLPVTRLDSMLCSMGIDLFG